MKTKKQTSKTISIRVSPQKAREIDAFAASEKELVSDLFREAIQRMMDDKRVSDELTYMNARMEQMEKSLSEIKQGQAGLKDNLSALCELVQGDTP